MRVEIQHASVHDRPWVIHDVPGAVNLAAAAVVASRESNAGILTDDNHDAEVRPDVGRATGTISYRRRHDAPPLGNPAMQRLASFWGGNKAGDYWFATYWREPHPHGTLAVDDHGRRWALVRLCTDYAKWECVTDPRMLAWDMPGPSAGKACCGNPHTAEQRVCERHGGPWKIGGEATAQELRVLDATRLHRHDLMVLEDVEVGTCTPTQAAARLKCGRGQAGRDAFARRTRRLLADLRAAMAGERVPAEADGANTLAHVTFDDARREVLRLAGIWADVEAARALRVERCRKAGRRVS